ncbi:hypothetical protein [Streptomyces sp. NRRL F-4489]|uniref:DedA family protein n=1 Tax=Streptomyces sp. NRRL F-4489 TaxID=1609095 RepID=UPI002D21B599|nr:hypothetical protein [Streptomyces sp. NRRL F-4489]
MSASVPLLTTAAEPAGGIAGWTVDVMGALGAAGAGLTNLVDTVLPFIPSEVVLPVAGFAAGQGRLSLVAVIVWTTAGSIAGSWIVYAAGALLGRDRTRALAARIPLARPPARPRSTGPRNGSNGGAAPPCWWPAWCRWCAVSSPSRPASSACRYRPSPR